MKIKLENNETQVELIKAAGSKVRATSEAAMEVLASLVSPIIQTTIELASNSEAIYTKLPYSADSNPSIPLDLYIDKTVDYVRVWSQSIAGGLPSNHIQGLQELKFVTYELDSAVTMLKQFARVGGLNNLARALNRLSQELLVKTEINAFTPVLAALASASTNNLQHTIGATTAQRFQLDDLNRLLTRVRKINAATINGGTPANAGKGLTDLFVSPEVLQDIRSFVYQPLNTRSGAVTTSGATAIALTDSVRDAIYNNAGASELFGVAIHELLELSPEGAYSTIFSNYYGAGTPTFTLGTSQLVLGVDMSREALLSPVEVDDNGGTVVTQPDDQYQTRASRIGFFSTVHRGSVIVDDRVLTGVII